MCFAFVIFKEFQHVVIVLNWVQHVEKCVTRFGIYKYEMYSCKLKNEKKLLLLEHGFHAQLLLFYRSGTQWVLLGFILYIRVIVIYGIPYGHIVSCKEISILSLKCQNTSKIKSAYMKSHVYPWKSLYIERNLSSINITHSSLDMQRMGREEVEEESAKKRKSKRSKCFGPYLSLLWRSKLGFLHWDLQCFDLGRRR